MPSNNALLNQARCATVRLCPVDDMASDMGDEFEVRINIMDSPLIRQLCKHELGHYVVAREFGAKPASISVTFTGPNRFSGHCEISFVRQITAINDVREYLEHRVAILMAGTLGEHLTVDDSEACCLDKEVWLANATNAYNCAEGSQSDKNKADELIRMLAFMDRSIATDSKASLQDRMNEISRRIWLETANQLELISREFYAVSGLLADRVTHLDVPVVTTCAEIETFFDAARPKTDRDP